MATIVESLQEERAKAQAIVDACDVALKAFGAQPVSAASRAKAGYLGDLKKKVVTPGLILAEIPEGVTQSASYLAQALSVSKYRVNVVLKEMVKEKQLVTFGSGTGLKYSLPLKVKPKPG